MKFNFLIFLILIQLINGWHHIRKECKMGVNCELPTCNCESAENLAFNKSKLYRRDELPQLVVLTIDDDNLDVFSYRIYKRLFESLNKKRHNTKRCDVKATFFLSDSRNRTSYCLVRNLFERGHEIAVSTVNYTCPHKRCPPVRGFRPWKYTDWKREIVEMRERVVNYAGIEKSKILGFRAPLLEPTGDVHFNLITGAKFLYDSSLIIQNEDFISWPFTLDFPSRNRILNNGPRNLFPGFWELAIPRYVEVNKRQEIETCLKIWDGECKLKNTVKAIAKFLRKHFLRTYYNNRAPLVLHFTADWLKSATITRYNEALPNIGFANPLKRFITKERVEYRNVDALIKFIDDTLKFNRDVYFVTAQQVIEWMKMMPRLEREKLNLAEFIESEIAGCDFDHEAKYDAKCEALNESDFDSDNENLFLDDDLGVQQSHETKGLLDENKLTELQSEVLFLNKNVLYFVFVLFTIAFLIILHDKYI